MSRTGEDLSDPIAFRGPQLRYLWFAARKRRLSASVARTSDRAAEGRLCVAARGGQSRGGRPSSFAVRVIAAFALVGALLPASPALPGLATASAAVPAGFTETTQFSGLTNPTAIRFAPDGRVFVAEKSGIIKVFDSPVRRRRRPSSPTCGRTSTTSGIVASSGWPSSPTFPDRSLHLRPLRLRPHPRHRRQRPAVGASTTPCPTPPGADHRRLRGQRPAVAVPA